MLFSAVLLSLQGFLAFAKNVSKEDAENYPEFADILSYFGYAWEAHPIVTDDGWHLTLFRVTGPVGSEDKDEEDESRRR